MGHIIFKWPNHSNSSDNIRGFVGLTYKADHFKRRPKYLQSILKWEPKAPSARDGSAFGHQRKNHVHCTLTTSCQNTPMIERNVFSKSKSNGSYSPTVGFEASLCAALSIWNGIKNKKRKRNMNVFDSSRNMQFQDRTIQLYKCTILPSQNFV